MKRSVVLSWMRFICLVVFSDRKNHHVGQESPPLSSVQRVTCGEEGGGQWYLGWSQMNTTPPPTTKDLFMCNESRHSYETTRLEPCKSSIYSKCMIHTRTKHLPRFCAFSILFLGFSSNLHLLSPSLPKYRLLNKPIRSLNEQNQCSLVY